MGLSYRWMVFLPDLPLSVRPTRSGVSPDSGRALLPPNSVGGAGSASVHENRTRISPGHPRHKEGDYRSMRPGSKSVTARRVPEALGYGAGRAGADSSLRRSRTRSARYSAIASEDVAAGDGAFRTAVTRPRLEIRKSSTSAPSRPRAWARTPDGPATRSALVSSGT